MASLACSIEIPRDIGDGPRSAPFRANLGQQKHLRASSQPVRSLPRRLRILRHCHDAGADVKVRRELPHRGGNVPVIVADLGQGITTLKRNDDSCSLSAASPGVLREEASATPSSWSTCISDQFQEKGEDEEELISLASSRTQASRCKLPRRLRILRKCHETGARQETADRRSTSVPSSALQLQSHRLRAQDLLLPFEASDRASSSSTDPPSADDDQSFMSVTSSAATPSTRSSSPPHQADEDVCSLVGIRARLRRHQQLSPAGKPFVKLPRRLRILSHCHEPCSGVELEAKLSHAAREHESQGGNRCSRSRSASSLASSSSSRRKELDSRSEAARDHVEVAASSVQLPRLLGSRPSAWDRKVEVPRSYKVEVPALPRVSPPPRTSGMRQSASIVLAPLEAPEGLKGKASLHGGRLRRASSAASLSSSMSTPLVAW